MTGRSGWHGRGSRHERGYGSGWDKLRLRILDRDKWLCQCPDCLGGIKRVREAHEVDHIVPKARGGDDAPENLRAVNRDCHRKLTTMQNGGKPRVAIGIYGWPIEG